MEHWVKLRGIALRAGDVRISINQDGGAGGWDRIKGFGIFSISLAAVNVDELAKKTRKYRARLDKEPRDMP
jgi:hypothetical protein